MIRPSALGGVGLYVKFFKKRQKIYPYELYNNAIEGLYFCLLRLLKNSYSNLKIYGFNQFTE